MVKCGTPTGRVGKKYEHGIILLPPKEPAPELVQKLLKVIAVVRGVLGGSISGGGSPNHMAIRAVLYGFDLIAPTTLALEKLTTLFGLGVQVLLKSAVMTR